MYLFVFKFFVLCVTVRLLFKTVRPSYWKCQASVSSCIHPYTATNEICRTESSLYRKSSSVYNIGSETKPKTPSFETLSELLLPSYMGWHQNVE
jgi:hypothetical protein